MSRPLEHRAGPIHRVLGALAPVARSARRYQILRTIASTTSERHNVVNLVAPTETLAAPVAASALALVLSPKVIVRVAARGIPQPGVCGSSSTLDDVRILGCPVPVRGEQALSVLTPIAPSVIGQVVRMLCAPLSGLLSPLLGVPRVVSTEVRLLALSTHRLHAVDSTRLGSEELGSRREHQPAFLARFRRATLGGIAPLPLSRAALRLILARVLRSTSVAARSAPGSDPARSIGAGIEELSRRWQLATALRTRLERGTIGAHRNLVSVATPRELTTRRGTFVPPFYHFPRMEAAA